MVNRQKQKLKQIIYTSKPAALEDNTIDEILASSHKYNSKSGVTGLLIFGVELYMQFLEGPVQELDGSGRGRPSWCSSSNNNSSSPSR